MGGEVRLSKLDIGARWGKAISLLNTCTASIKRCVCYSLEQFFLLR